MPVWQLLLDAAGIVLGIVLLYGIALIVRRRVLARRGGTFELSHRARTAKVGRGWVLGLGRYTSSTLEWFRIFSLNPRPHQVWQRGDLTYVDLAGRQHRHDRLVVGHDPDLAGEGPRIDHGRLAGPDLAVGRDEGDLHGVGHRQRLFWISSQRRSTSSSPPHMKNACSATWS